MMLYGFNRRRAQTLTRIADENSGVRQKSGRALYQEPLPDTPVTIVKKTSDTRDGTSGFFPGKLMIYANGALSEGDDIWIEDLNDIT